MLRIGNNVYRNLQEQVGENTKQIEDIKNRAIGIESAEIVDGELILHIYGGETINCGEVKSITAMSFDVSRHLIVQYNTGEEVDLGQIKSVTSFSINGSQHLIVTYDDGTTQDLGEIFSGNVNINGNLTANSIIENMAGYSFTPQTTTKGSINYVYAGIVKNGNKLTIALAYTFTKNENAAGSFYAGQFTLPLDVLNKIYPFQSSIIDTRKSIAFDGSNLDEVESRLIKGGNVVTFAVMDVTNLVANTPYYIRHEVTILLSEDLS